MTPDSYVLITRQPGAIGGHEVNAYGPGERESLEGAGHLLADGADPPMSVEVLPLAPAQWDSL